MKGRQKQAKEFTVKNYKDKIANMYNKSSGLNRKLEFTIKIWKYEKQI